MKEKRTASKQSVETIKERARPLSRKEVRQNYQKRQDHFKAVTAKLKAHSRLISTGRLLFFLLSVCAFVIGFWGLTFRFNGYSIFGLLSLIFFIALVIWHERVFKELDRVRILSAINRESIKRMDRQWKDLPVASVPCEASSDPVARDLDIFPTDHNHASLYQLLGTVNCPQGQKTLISWLQSSSSISIKNLYSRQNAVDELAPDIEFRQDLDLRGRLLGDRPPDPEIFLEWSEGEPWLHKKKFLLWATRLLALATPTLGILVLFDKIPIGWLVSVLGFNLILCFCFSKKILETYDTISGRKKSCQHYAGIFHLLDNQAFECTKLKELKNLLQAKGKNVSTHMKRLTRLNEFAEARFTPLFHWPLEAFFLWDFHVISGFEKWQQEVGSCVRNWFDALGEIEALCALATILYDHPQWTFPSLDLTHNTLEATKLGHPLLPPEGCVTNDITIGPHGTFSLITGSNMSGKSTLLRSIGTNVLLAQAGGPVCAEEFSMPPLILGTSFRVHDSLEAGVSFFMAELKRLKEIVDLSEHYHRDDQVTVLYLLDEILQGTNVSERQVAVRRVILHLLKFGSIGAISTHDLTLAEADGLSQACQPYNFMETYSKTKDGPHMSFDYKLRPGIASTVNALKLLEIVGLGEEKSRESTPPPHS